MDRARHADFNRAKPPSYVGAGERARRRRDWPATRRSSCTPTVWAGCGWRRAEGRTAAGALRAAGITGAERRCTHSRRIRPPIESSRPDNPYARAAGDPAYPHVLTTYRLTEHHTAGGMSRTLSQLAELQPALFCEISPELARELAVENGDVVTITTPRGSIVARALVTPGCSRCRSSADGASGRPAVSFRRPRPGHRRRRQRSGRDVRGAERADHGIEGAGVPDRTRGSMNPSSCRPPASSPTRRSASAARPARSRARSGTTSRTTGSRSPGCPTTTPAALGHSTWRHVKFVERGAATGAAADGGYRSNTSLGLLVRRLQALRARRLPRGVSDRLDRPHRVRRRLHPARHLQRLRLLRRRLPVRRRRSPARRRPRVQVHVLLRPAESRAAAGVREGVSDAVDPVRRSRRAARAAARRGSRSCTRAASTDAVSSTIRGTRASAARTRSSSCAATSPTTTCRRTRSCRQRISAPAGAPRRRRRG